MLVARDISMEQHFWQQVWPQVAAGVIVAAILGTLAFAWASATKRAPAILRLPGDGIDEGAWPKRWLLMLIGGAFLVLFLLGIFAYVGNRHRDSAGGTSAVTASCFPKNWIIVGPPNSSWQCHQDAIKAQSTLGDTMLTSSESYSDVRLSATVSSNSREASLVVRMSDDGRDGYLVIFEPDGISWNNGVGGVWLAKRYQGAEYHLGYFHDEDFPRLGQTAQLSVMASSYVLTIWLNGEQIVQRTDSSFVRGRVGLRTNGDAEIPSDATFEDIVVTRLNRD